MGGKTVGKNPTDRGQSGTKRRMRPDGRGVPIGLAVAGAPRHACTMAQETSERIAVERPDPTTVTPPGRCLAQGDDDEEVRAWRTELGCSAPSRARG